MSLPRKGSGKDLHPLQLVFSNSQNLSCLLRIPHTGTFARSSGIGGILCDFNGEISFLYKHRGIKDSNEVEIVVILEALRSYVSSFLVQEPLISKSDSANVVSRVSSVVGNSWKFFYYLKDICNILVLIFLV